MRLFVTRSRVIKIFFLVSILGAYSCAPKVACPTGQKESKELFAGAEKGKTEKARTANGLIKKKKKKKKQRKKR